MSYSDEQLLTIQKETLAKLRALQDALAALRNHPGSLVEKWQQLLQIVLGAQLDVMKRHDLITDQTTLSRFNDAYAQRAQDSAELATLNKEKWLFVFDKVFGIREFKELSLSDARLLIADIVDAMTAPTFLQTVDASVAALPLSASLIERRQAVMTVLFPLHLSVMAKHGFPGEEGYIQAQRALMDHYSDPIIAQSASRAQAVVFRRARLI
jgi:hypothetical protein